MRLAEKLEHLRSVEGQLRGLGRPLNKAEMARLMRVELGESLSLPYLSQIESGARPHLTAHSRELLARFFNVHPGYLVGDPDGFQEGLESMVEAPSADLSAWLAQRAEEMRGDPDVFEALLCFASQPDARAALVAAARSIGSRSLDEGSTTWVEEAELIHA
ncbi:MAG: hypothetical protein HW416_1825 [Chloroflexi bacterium]|nr:hypothetical protein [Chloroflexota bacterium]